MFESFDNSASDFSSNRNLAGSFMVSSVFLLLLGFLLAQAGKEVVKHVEKQMEVTFVEELPPEPEPAPPPPKLKNVPPPAAAPVVPDHLKKVVVDTPPPVKPLEAPVEIEKAPLAEADPSQDKGVIVVGNGEGDPAGVEGGSVNGVAGGQVDAPALPEKATAPIPSDDNRAPEYPESAKAAGTIGMVILKVVIDAAGNVEDVKVMRGESPFVEAALAAVKTWKYAPAMFDGKSIRVYRIIKIPFRLRT